MSSASSWRQLGPIVESDIINHTNSAFKTAAMRTDSPVRGSASWVMLHQTLINRWAALWAASGPAVVLYLQLLKLLQVHFKVSERKLPPASPQAKPTNSPFQTGRFITTTAPVNTGNHWFPLTCWSGAPSLLCGNLLICKLSCGASSDFWIHAHLHKTKEKQGFK